MTGAAPDLARRILADNLALHSRTGYPEFYDQHVGLVANPWERRIVGEHLRTIARQLVSASRARPPLALDLGAGTGNVALRLLDLGFAVTAVDVAQPMLDRLCAKIRGPDAGRLETICQTADEALETFLAQGRQFDLVAGCSVLHHLPDYLHTTGLAARVLGHKGWLYFAHEPLRRNTVTPSSRVLQWLDFKLWRLQTHLNRRLGRRAPGDEFWSPECLADYWDLVGGCDHHALARTLRHAGLRVRIIAYDSKRSRILNVAADCLATATLFALFAQNAPQAPSRRASG